MTKDIFWRLAHRVAKSLVGMISAAEQWPQQNIVIFNNKKISQYQASCMVRDLIF